MAARHGIKPESSGGEGWREYPDVPNTNIPPQYFDLPETRSIVVRGEIITKQYEAETKRWWANVRQMPHTVDWNDGDWIFALDTAVMVDSGNLGIVSGAGQARQRDKDVLGTTSEYRRDLRIHYYDPADDEVVVSPEEIKKQKAAEAAAEKRRKRLLQN
jgi:hypothetical protein